MKKTIPMHLNGCIYSHSLKEVSIENIDKILKAADALEMQVIIVQDGYVSGPLRPIYTIYFYKPKDEE